PSSMPDKPNRLARPHSFDLNARRMDDLAPFGRILAQIFGKGVERARYRLQLKALEIRLLEFAIADDLLHVGVDILDDGRRRARGGKQPERYARLVSRNGLGDGRHAGKLRQALLAAESEHLELSVLHRTQRHRWTHDHRVDVSSNHISECGCRAAIV